jgi:hypothetical protein
MSKKKSFLKASLSSTGTLIVGDDFDEPIDAALGMLFR